MSEFNPESLENNCRSLRMEPSLSDFQVAWIMDLANKSEQLTAANDSLRKAIEEHKKYNYGLFKNPTISVQDQKLYTVLEQK